jgi:hypothetical protein
MPSPSYPPCLRGAFLSVMPETMPLRALGTGSAILLSYKALRPGSYADAWSLKSSA